MPSTVPDPDPAAAARDASTDALEQHQARAQDAALAAVVTSDLGVLIGHARGLHSSWQFPAIGSVDGDETAAAALVRGVRQQTGLNPVVHCEIGRDVDLYAGRETIYLACTPELGFGPLAAGGGLREVQWIRWPEIDQVMPGMPWSVRDFLIGRLGWQGPR